MTTIRGAPGKPVLGKPALNAFVLKTWLEPREIEGQLPEFRAQIDDVQTGSRTYFKTIDELVHYLRRRLTTEPTATNNHHREEEK